MRRFFCLVTIVVSAVLVSAQGRLTKTLDVYVVDVEGGNATLVVSPSGESLLIDTGNGGMGAVRDAGRIMEAARDAGITQIDHLIKVSAQQDGTFTVTNARNGFSKVYRREVQGTR